MHTIQFSGLHFAYPGSDALLKDFNLTLHAGVYALAGRNGAGKSTIIRLIMGELHPDRGSILLNGGCVPAYLAQGNHVRTEEKTLSLGEAKMEKLALLFRDNKGVLLLDEPETHLDAANRRWLLERLSRFKGLVLMVSHDRELLNTAHAILHLENAYLRVYSLEYVEYSRQLRAERGATVKAMERKQREISARQRSLQTDIERQVRRSNNAARRAPLAGIPRVARGVMKRNAEKTLGKLQRRMQDQQQKNTRDLSELRVRQSQTLKFQYDHHDMFGLACRRQLEVIDLQFWQFNGEPLWQKPLRFSGRAGERICIQGRNGSGKSQLFAAFMGNSALRFSGMIAADHLRPLLIDARFSLLSAQQKVLHLAKDFLSDLPEGELRRLLGAFGYPGDKVFQPFQSLSAGEKMRLYLMLITKSPRAINCVLFDEAEAGLDADTHAVVIEFLLNFRGIMLYASHDAAFAAALYPHQTVQLMTR